MCVVSCSMRALEFGPLEELEKKYGKLKSFRRHAERYSDQTGGGLQTLCR